MDIFPISLKLQQQPCLIVGGGHIAYRKAVLLAKAHAVIHVLSPEIDANLLALVNQTQGQYISQKFDSARSMRNFRLVIAATNDKVVNQAVFEACEAENVLVHCTDERTENSIS